MFIKHYKQSPHRGLLSARPLAETQRPKDRSTLQEKVIAIIVRGHRSFVGFLVGFVVNLEVAELIGVLVGGNNSEVLAHLLFLKVLLREVLQVSLGEVNFSLDDNTVLVLGDGDCIGEVTSLTINLDLLGEVVREVPEHDNVVLNRESTVNGELGGGLLGLCGLAGFLANNLGHCDVRSL